MTDLILPRGDSSPRCLICNLPPSWHLARNRKYDKGLWCWDQARNYGKTRAWNRTRHPSQYAPPKGAPSKGDEWRNLIHTLDTLTDLRKRAA